MVGSHVIKCWSARQPGVAMSSGEAEFYGVVRAAAARLGIKALYNDMNVQLPLRVWTDSSAAIGICNRQGLGKRRHLECTSLWIQQRLRLGELQIRKVHVESNPADFFTKHLESKAKIEQLVSLFNCEFKDGSLKITHCRGDLSFATNSSEIAERLTKWSWSGERSRAPRTAEDLKTQSFADAVRKISEEADADGLCRVAFVGEMHEEDMDEVQGQSAHAKDVPDGEAADPPHAL